MSETARADGGAARSRPTQDLSASEIARQLPEQLSRLVREELRLAQIEMTQKGKRAGVGAGMLGGGGVVAGYAAAAVLASIILALAKVVPAWASALIVGGVLLAAAAALAGLGGKQLRRAKPPVPQQTASSVKADAEEIRERAHR